MVCLTWNSGNKYCKPHIILGDPTDPLEQKTFESALPYVSFRTEYLQLGGTHKDHPLRLVPVGQWCFLMDQINLLQVLTLSMGTNQCKDPIFFCKERENFQKNSNFYKTVV